jgi:hypothetical protein
MQHGHLNILISSGTGSVGRKWMAAGDLFVDRGELSTLVVGETLRASVARLTLTEFCSAPEHVNKASKRIHLLRRG